MIFRRIGAVPMVEAQIKAVEILFAARRNFRYEFLRRNPAFLCGDHNRCTMDVVRPDEMHPIAGHSFVTNPNVGLNVFHDVPNVEGAVGVGQGGGDEKITL